MATEANKSILADAGLLTDEVKTATPNDLVIAVSSETNRWQMRLCKKSIAC